VPADVPREQRAGFLPEHRRADNPTLLLLKKAMESNRKSARN
jgi:hypothetical protein